MRVWSLVLAIVVHSALPGVAGMRAYAQGARDPSERLDKHSFGNPDVAVVRHIDLDLTVDFATKTLSGQALLTISRKGEGPLVLDTRDLTINKVEAGATI